MLIFYCCDVADYTPTSVFSDVSQTLKGYFGTLKAEYGKYGRYSANCFRFRADRMEMSTKAIAREIDSTVVSELKTGFNQMLKYTFRMINKIWYLLLFISIKASGYVITDDYLNYINNLDISYHSLSLTAAEIQAIEALQQSGGITYGIYDNEIPVTMVFDQISKVFNIDVTPVHYMNFNQLLDDVASGAVDFTSNILPTEERMKIYDYTFSSNKEKVFLFWKREEYIKYYINPPSVPEKKTVVYPYGYEYRDLIENSLGKIFELEYKTVETAKEANQLIESGEADLVICSIPWYEEVSEINEYIGIDYTEHFNMYFSGTVTRKNTNKELISAINKLYVETSAVTQLQKQMDNYYEYELMNIVSKKYDDVISKEEGYVVLLNEYKPYSFEESGEVKGLVIELLDRIFNHYSISYKRLSYSIDSLKLSNKTQHEKIDIAMPMLLTKRNMDSYSLTIPIAENSMSIISKEENKSTHLSKVEDFNIKKMGAVKSRYMIEYIDSLFYNSNHIVYYDSVEEIVNAIDNDDIPYGLVSYEKFNKYAIENNLINISVLKDIELPVYKVSLGMAKTEQGKRLASFFSSVIDSINYSDLERRYLSSRAEIEAIYENRAKMLSYLTIIVVLTSIMIISLLFFITVNNRRRATTDYLTKLSNRRTLNHYIKNVRQKSGMNIAYIDLDNFKIINDMYGHQYGDRVLIYVASELKKTSKTAKAFRIGGDEFILVYDRRQVGIKDIGNIFNKYIKIEGANIKVEGSIGNIKLESYDEFEVEDIINLVDYAMLTAKRKGKNTLVEIDNDLVESFFVTNEIRQSLENNLDEEKLKAYIRVINNNSSELAIFELIPKYHHRNNIINYEDMEIYTTNKIILDNVEFLQFERLCKLKSKLNLSSSGNSYVLAIHPVLTDVINCNYIERLSNIISTNEVDTKDIILKINTNMFNVNGGKQQLELLNRLNCKVSIDLFNLVGSALVFFKYLNIHMVEVDVSAILTFFKSLHEEDEISEAFKNSLLTEALSNICLGYETDVLLYISNRKEEQVIIDVIESKINTTIYYYENKELEQLDTYVNKLSVSDRKVSQQQICPA